MRSRYARVFCLVVLSISLAQGAGAQTAAAPITISMTYKPPGGWYSTAPAGAGSSYYVRDGDKVHTLTFASVSPKAASEVEAYAAERIGAERQRGAEVADDGPVTACDGQPAHRWSVVSASTGVAMETHVLAAQVTGGLATATYGHRQGVGDRRDALDAMATLCPGPFPNPVPAGWTAPKTRLPVATLDSPDSTSTFVASFRPLAPDRFDAFERDAMPAGKVVADRHDPCGSAATVHRVDVQIGGQIAEIAVAYVHRTAYRYVYTRPAAHEADTGAERALTAFCRATSAIPAASSAPI
jgi:hypothetical protein